MKITVAKSAGFCAGVARAINTAYEELGKTKLATLGALIHNQIVINDLAEKGVRVINNLDEIKDETIIIRSHGIPLETENELRRRNIPYIDRTCPCVKAVHNKAASNKKLIILGDASHPEVIGTASYAKHSVIITNDETKLLPQLNPNEKYILVAQTTFETEIFTRITATLQAFDIEIHNTICSATSTRQKEAAELAKKSDTMIIIGDKTSANTRALYEISRKICPKTFFIASVSDLLLQYLSSSDKIGVTAGASTPPALTKEAVQRMSEFANAVPEETFEQMLDEYSKPLHSGRIVKGTVIRVTPTEVTVDLGYKSDGIITRQEFSEDTTTELTELTKPGDVFDVFVIRVNDGDGNILASKKKLDSQQNIKMLETALEEKTVVVGKVTEVIKGGLLVNIQGCKVFVPSSQVSNRFVEDLQQFKGQEMRLHMLEIDRSKRRFVAGRKDLATQEIREIREEMYAKLEEGQRLEGTVSRLVEFGAFVDIGGIDGLIHVSEMAWKRVRRASDILTVGDEVTVTVLAVDKEKNKISLSLKDIDSNPWNGIEEKYPEGSIVEGTVVRLAPFGAFVNLEDGIDGLVHISQIANRHIAKADEVLKVGQIIEVKVTSVDTETHRINLSKREADLDLGYELYEDAYDEEPMDEEMDIAEEELAPEDVTGE